MDLKQIKQVIDLMKRSDLTEFEVEEQGFKLRIQRNAGHAPVVSMPAPVPIAPLHRFEAPATAPTPAAPAAKPTPSEEDETGFVYVKSPMVGTFYRSPSPESPPFVEPNSKVSENTVVCIIEAMKIMNEIQAEVKGTIVEVLLENGQPVEYGQRLFKVKAG